MRSEVEVWLALAVGNAMCADQLIGFVRSFDPDNQVRVGLPWVAKIVLADPAAIVGRAYMLTPWLKETRSAADRAGLSAKWQEVVDAMVVAGDPGTCTLFGLERRQLRRREPDGRLRASPLGPGMQGRLIVRRHEREVTSLEARIRGVGWLTPKRLDSSVAPPTRC